MKNWLKIKGKRRIVFVMPVILLMVLFTMQATAQGSWPGITGNAEKNTVTGLYRWNFGTNGVFNPNLIFLGKSDTIRRNARMDSINAANSTALASKQATLVSGTNIKTINSGSVLGSGNILLQTPLTFTAGGITNTAGNISLGGAFTNYIELDPGSNGMSIVSTSGGQLTLRSGPSTSFHSFYNQTPTTISSYIQNSGSSVNGIFINNGYIRVQDDINLKGLTYNADYSANGILDNRWIPDYGAVKNYVASASTLPTLGTIINETFSGTLSNWTNVGSAAFTIVGGQLQVVNSSGIYSSNNYLWYSAYGLSNLESSNISFDLYPGTPSATSFGTGITYESGGSYQQNTIRILPILTSGANQGHIQFEYVSAGTITTTTISTGGLVFSSGDHLKVTSRFIKNKFIVTLSNITTNMANTAELDISPAASPTFTYAYILPNSYKYGLFAAGGTQLVDNYLVVGNDAKGATILGGFDSRSKGYTTSNFSTRYLDLIGSTTNAVTIANGGPGNTIEDINTAEVLSLAPQNIVIEGGINNIQRVDALSTVETRYAAMISAYVTGGYALGVNLFPCLLAPGPNFNATAYGNVQTFNTWLITTYGSACIDFYTPLFGTAGTPLNTQYTIDGIHVNDAGQVLEADAVIIKLGLSDKSKKQGNVFPLYRNANNKYLIADQANNGNTPNYLLDIIGNDRVNTSFGAQLHINSSTVDNGIYQWSYSNGFSGIGNNITEGTQNNYTFKATDGAFTLYQRGILQIGTFSGATIGGITSSLPPTMYMTGGQVKFGAQNVGPKAIVHIAPGGTAANSAAFKIDAGSLLTTAESGAFEFNGTDLFYTTSTPTRRTVANLLAAQTFNNKTFAPANIYQTPTGTAGTDSVMVKIGSGKTLGAISPTYYTTQAGNDALYLKISDIRNAANFGLTGSVADIAHYDNPAGDQTYRVGGWVNLLSVSGGDAVVMQVTWTDNHSVTTTKDFYPQGAVTSSLTTVGNYAFPTMDFRVKSGTTVQVLTTVSGGGSIIYEAGSTIQKVQGS